MIFDDELSIPEGYTIDNNYKQSLLIVGTSYSTFRYHELFNGYNETTLEIWSHEIDIRASLETPSLFDGYVGVDSIFSYEELFGYATNYTSDGSTIPTWTRKKAEGFVTLTNTTDIGVVIPAPSALILGSIGVGFVTWLRKRRTL